MGINGSVVATERPGRSEHEVPAAPSVIADDADRLAALGAKRGGHYTRERLPDGAVRIKLVLQSGDVAAASGATTAAAVQALLAKLGETDESLAGGAP